jgi:polysaccharide export outer membrane protein
MAGMLTRGMASLGALALMLLTGAACAQTPPQLATRQATPTQQATTPSQQSAPTQQTPPPVQAPPPAVQPAQGATPVVPGANDNQYVIGPGDTVQVFVWRNPELSVTVPVRPDGKISTPLVEDLVAVGKTSSQLAREIEKALAEYIRSPQVNIIVTNPISTYSQVKVIGEVVTPQSMPYREGLTVLDVVLAVGGLTEFAAGNRAKIVRQENGKTVEIKVKLESLVRKGKVDENKALRPGDVLIVPESFF